MDHSVVIDFAVLPLLVLISKRTRILRNFLYFKQPPQNKFKSEKHFRNFLLFCKRTSKSLKCVESRVRIVRVFCFWLFCALVNEYSGFGEYQNWKIECNNIWRCFIFVPFHPSKNRIHTTSTPKHPNTFYIWLRAIGTQRFSSSVLACRLPKSRCDLLIFVARACQQ